MAGSFDGRTPTRSVEQYLFTLKKGTCNTQNHILLVLGIFPIDLR
jgi:hypothetical protein